MANCTGNGTCLTQGADGNYSIFPNEECEYKCQAIKCPNFKLCGKIEPQWLYSTNMNTDICKSCDMATFGIPDSLILGNFKGKFTFFENSRCDYCAEITTLVQLPSCTHKVCIEPSDPLREPLRWDPRRGSCFQEYFQTPPEVQLNPIDFGCPRCPNGCDKGPGILQPGIPFGCNCEEFLKLYEEVWIKCKNPDEKWYELCMRGPIRLSRLQSKINEKRLCGKFCPLDGNEFDFSF